MNMQEKVTKEIINLCGGAEKLSSYGWHFVHNSLHYFYAPDNDQKYIRITIPHISKVIENNMNEVTNAVNETNREVKFIKAVILKKGSISISYDHKIAENEDIAQIVQHMITTLDFASKHLINKIKDSSFGSSEA